MISVIKLDQRRFSFSSAVRERARELRRAVAGAVAPAQPRRDTPAAQGALAASQAEALAPLPWANPEPPARGSEPQPTFYVERPADTAALQAIRGQGITLAITGARQVGKTSLLARTTAEACRYGKCVLTLDLQLFERTMLADTNSFFRALCEVASAGLGVESRVDAFWGNLGDTYNCTRYFEYLQGQLSAPLVLAFDKLERLPDTALRASFYSMLRAWCDSRATSPIWKQFDLLLVTSLEIDQFTESAYQSPFSAGLTIALDDFTPEQVADLNERHGRPFAPQEFQALIDLLAGHPYLIRQALYFASVGLHTPAEIIGTAAGDEGAFSDHLRYQLFKLSGQTRLLAELRQILGRGASLDAWAFEELRAAGLVRRDGERAVARCRLYGAYFQKHLLAAA
ncbi:MAG TPA: AAA-like domain-containing protein [Roseiflexaceae bacterium]|nr:AAA-like domain-containing protein [Roseiflexaceae bacterium]